MIGIIDDMNKPQEERDPVHTERCECGCLAIEHSLCFWLAHYYGGKSPIGACGKCADCHSFKGPEGSKLFGVFDASKLSTPFDVYAAYFACPDCVPGTGYVCEVHKQAGIKDAIKNIMVRIQLGLKGHKQSHPAEVAGRIGNVEAMKASLGSIGVDLAAGDEHTSVVINVPHGMFGSDEPEMDFLEAGLRLIAISASDDPEAEWANKYGTDYENDIFKMAKFCYCELEVCEKCAGTVSNFTYKKTDFRIDWYKFIGRDMECYSGEIEEANHLDIARIIFECMESIDKDKKKE